MVDQATTRYFPYVGASGWFTKLHQLCVRSMPSNLSIDWMMPAERVGLSQTNARALLSMLQRLGWVDEDGTVTSKGKQLRLVGEPWQSAMQGQLQETYGDLVKQIEDAESFSVQELDHYFVAATDVGSSGRSHMISMFRLFVKEAGRSDLEAKIWKAGRAPSSVPSSLEARRDRSGSGRGKRREAPDQNHETPSAKASHQTNKPQNGDARLHAIAAVLKVNVDGTWDEAKLKSAFSLLDRLLKGEEIGS